MHFMSQATLDVAPARRRGRGKGYTRLYLAVLAICGALYALTAQRGPAWQDSGIFQIRILDFDLFGWLGLALSHPLLIVLGKAFSYLPWGPLAWRINLVSAISGAVAAANVALLVRGLCPRPAAAAWIGAGFFALAHATWWLATICESQLVLAALLTLHWNLLLSLLRRPSPGIAAMAALTAGLALTAHDMALLAAPGLAGLVVWLWVRRRLGGLGVALAAVGYLAGASGYLLMVAHEASLHGLGPAVRSALFGNAWQAPVLGASVRATGMGVLYVLLDFPNLALPLAVFGILAARRLLPKGGGWLGVYLLGVYLAFPIRYSVPDQFMFFVPFCALVSVLAGLGAGGLTFMGRRWIVPAAAVSLLLTPAIYAVGPAAWKGLHLPSPGRQDLAYRDTVRYWLSPWKFNEDSAGRFVRQVFAELPPGATLVADGTSAPALLWVQRVEGVNPTAAILHSGHATPAVLPPGTANVFVLSTARGYYPRWLDGAATMRKAEPNQFVYEVVWNPIPAAH